MLYINKYEQKILASMIREDIINTHANILIESSKVRNKFFLSEDKQVINNYFKQFDNQPTILKEGFFDFMIQSTGKIVGDAAFQVKEFFVNSNDDKYDAMNKQSDANIKFQSDRLKAIQNEQTRLKNELDDARKIADEIDSDSHHPANVADDKLLMKTRDPYSEYSHNAAKDPGSLQYHKTLEASPESQAPADDPSHQVAANASGGLFSKIAAILAKVGAGISAMVTKVLSACGLTPETVTAIKPYMTAGVILVGILIFIGIFKMIINYIKRRSAERKSRKNMNEGKAVQGVNQQKAVAEGIVLAKTSLTMQKKACGRIRNPQKKKAALEVIAQKERKFKQGMAKYKY